MVNHRCAHKLYALYSILFVCVVCCNFLPCPRNFKLKNGHNHVQFFKCDQRAIVPEDMSVAYLEFSVTLLLVSIGL
jgi:hypothetical protein